jgi:hypothetical protein
MFLCSDEGVERKAPLRVLPRLVASDIYHPPDSSLLFNPVIAPAESADIASEYSIGLFAAQAQLTVYSVS